MPSKLKMGSNFLAGVIGFTFLASLSFGQDGQILLPDTPVSKPPPSRSKEAREKDFEQRKEALDKKINREVPKEPTASEVTTKKLLEESIIPRPNRVLASLSLVWPFASVSGERENYTFDPGLVAHMQFRPSSSTEVNNLHLWTGFRSFFISGTGTYQDIPGRFSFIYFGPTIGVGKISLGPKSLPANVMEDQKSRQTALASQGGFFAFTGVAMQSRMAKREKGGKEPDDDLNTKGIAFDSPGIWAELTYTSVYYSALTVNYLAGVQLGKGKTIAYLGIGTGGIN